MLNNIKIFALIYEAKGVSMPRRNVPVYFYVGQYAKFYCNTQDVSRRERNVCMIRSFAPAASYRTNRINDCCVSLFSLCCFRSRRWNKFGRLQERGTTSAGYFIWRIKLRPMSSICFSPSYSVCLSLSLSLSLPLNIPFLHSLSNIHAANV